MKRRELPTAVMAIVLLKWFAFPPHIVKHVVDGLETAARWIEQALAWITREFI